MERKTMLFISYSSAEKQECQKVIEYIKQKGYEVWLAPDDIPAGKDYADVIPDAIRNCEAFIILLSEKSQRSKWVPKELDQAITASKTIVPFHMDDSKYTDAFDFRLSNVQRIEAYGRDEDALAELGTILGKIKDGTYDHLQKGVPASSNADTASTGVKKDLNDGKQHNKTKLMIGLVVAVVCIGAILIGFIIHFSSKDKEKKEGKGEVENTSSTTPIENIKDSEDKPGEDNPLTNEPDEHSQEASYAVAGKDDGDYDRQAAYDCAVSEYEENKYNQYLAYYMSDIIAAGGITDLGRQPKMLNVLRGVSSSYADVIEIELEDDYITTKSGLGTGDIVYAQCQDCGSKVRVWITGQADTEGRFCMLGAIWNDDTELYDGSQITKMYTKCDECPSDRMNYIGLHINGITHEPVYLEAKKGGPKHMVTDPEGTTSIYDRLKALEAAAEYYKASENNTALMASRVLKAAGLEAFPETLLTGEVRAILLENHYCTQKEIALDGGYVTEETGLLSGDMVVAYDCACDMYLRWWILGEADEDGRFTAYSPIRDYDTEQYDGTDAVIIETEHETCPSNHLTFYGIHMLNDDEQSERIAGSDDTAEPVEYFIDDPNSEFAHRPAYETAMAEYEDNKNTRWQSYMLSDIIEAGGIHDLGRQSRMSNVIRGLSGTYAEVFENIEIEEGYYISDKSGLCSGDIIYAKCKDCGSWVRSWIVGQADERGRFSLIGSIWEGDIDLYDGTHVSKAYTLCDECPSDRMEYIGLHITKVSKEPVYGKAKEGSPLHIVTESTVTQNSTDKTYNYDRELALEAAKKYYNAQENNSALIASRVLNAAGIKAMPEEVYVPTVREVLLANHYCEEKEIVPDEGFITEDMGLMTGDLILGYDYACDIYLRYWVVGEADEDGRYVLYSKVMEGDIDIYDGQKPTVIKAFCDKCPSEHCKYLGLHIDW